jgi:transposase-like protein
MAETKRMTVEQVVSYLLEEDGVDFLREGLRWVVQQLMEAEVSELIGAEHGERNPNGLRIATATGRDGGTRARPRSSSRFRRSAAAATSRASWSRAVAPNRRWCR